MNMLHFVSVLVTLVIFIAANVSGQQQQMQSPIHSARVYLFSANNLLMTNAGDPQTVQNIGMIDFRSMSGSNRGVMVNGSVYNLPAGNHAMHVHTYGDIGNGCSMVGPPFNPTNAPMGGSAPIVGNMGNINSQGNAMTYINLNQSMMSLMGPWSIKGRAVVIHTGNTTNIGNPFACGVLGISS